MAEQEKTLNFIEDYRIRPVLWDNQRPEYSDRNKRNEALIQMATIYEMTVRDVKNKIKSLRSYFAKENAKSDRRESAWFGYKHLQFILGPNETAVSKEAITENPRIPGVENYDLTTEEMDTSEENKCSKDSVDGEGQSGDLSYSTPRSSKVRKRTADHLLEDEGQRLLQLAADELLNKPNDDIAIFGEMIVCQLRKLSVRNQALARNQISNILHKFEMEEIDG